ncbi:MAG: hypothetical protein AAF630_06880 [Cyanobacteria bacterium P01_C01_bin.38]
MTNDRYRYAATKCDSDTKTDKTNPKFWLGCDKPKTIKPNKQKLINLYQGFVALCRSVSERFRSITARLPLACRGATKM